MNSLSELEQAKFLSVSTLNRYLAYRFEHDDNLATVYLEGEISNCKFSGGNLYFSLKDQDSEISALMFQSNVRTLSFTPQDGMLVQTVGRVGIYQKRGTYAITIRAMMKKGVGLLYQQYLDLKKKLDDEGLFLDIHKKKLPLYPKTIGVITSKTGEAINDITSTINKRYPLAKIVLYPALVQGSDAPKDLIRALDLAYHNRELDLIIIGRGGGSFEDLACFNDEALARKLFASPVATISAVGHEGDYTIVDFIASTRAATPTAAAMKAVCDQKEIMIDLGHLKQNLMTNFNTYLFNLSKHLAKYADAYVLKHFDEYLLRYDNRYNNLVNRLKMYSPSSVIQNQLVKMDNLQERMNKAMVNLYQTRFTLLKHLKQKLDIVNPLNLMEKGYAITYQDGKVITSLEHLDLTKNLTIRYKDGQVITKILEIKED